MQLQDTRKIWWSTDTGFSKRQIGDVLTSEEYCLHVASSQVPDHWLPHPFYANEPFWSQYWQAVFWAVEGLSPFPFFLCAVGSAVLASD